MTIWSYGNDQMKSERVSIGFYNYLQLVKCQTFPRCLDLMNELRQIQI